MQTTDAAVPRLAVVNGLRGVAIIAILYHHLVAPFADPFVKDYEVINGLMVSWYTPLTNTWMAVNLFFLLSGFVLALPYELGKRTMQSEHDAVAFLKRRALRLLPLYYFALVLALFLETRLDQFRVGSWRDVVGLFTFTFVFKSAKFLPVFDIALWSLAVEVGFSLALPLIIVLGRRIGMLPLTLAVFALSLAVRCYATLTHDGPHGQLQVLKDGPFGRLDDFMLGIAICRLYVKARLPPARYALPCVLAGSALILASGIGWDNVRLNVVPYIVGAFLHLATNLGTGLVLIGFLIAPAVMRAVVTFPGLQLFGMLTYSLYVWHMFGLTLLGPTWTPDKGPYVLAVTVVLSVLTYRYVEFPSSTFRQLFLSALGREPVEARTSQILSETNGAER